MDFESGKDSSALRANLILMFAAQAETIMDYETTIISYLYISHYIITNYLCGRAHCYAHIDIA